MVDEPHDPLPPSEWIPVWEGLFAPDEQPEERPSTNDPSPPTRSETPPSEKGSRDSALPPSPPLPEQISQEI
ncbi:MAG: hypothetical protein KDA80_16140, partial [Planctomycetaceae bacterium]|nr:hypothetical protein [Planctomycetaceae bacterium]